MSVQTTSLMHTFISLEQKEKYDVVVSIMKMWHGINKHYHTIYTYLMKNTTVSEETLYHIYDHALHLLQREGRKKQEQFAEKQTKLHHNIKHRQAKESDDSEIDNLLDNI